MNADKRRYLSVINFSLLIGLVVLFGNAHTGAEEKSIGEIVLKVRPSVVLVISYDEEGKFLKDGSGFFISKKGDVIAPLSVFVGARRAEVVDVEGKVHPVTGVLGENVEAGLIRFSVDIPQEIVIPLDLEQASPELGEPVILIGGLSIVEGRISKGIITAILNVPPLEPLVQISAKILETLEGSVAVTQSGGMIGTAASLVCGKERLNFVIPARIALGLDTDHKIRLPEWEGREESTWLESRDGLLTLGRIFQDNRKNKQALLVFTEMVGKFPEDYEARYYLAIALFNTGQHLESIILFQDTVKKMPGDARPHFHLGAAYLLLGDEAGARREYDILKEMDEAMAGKLGEMMEGKLQRDKGAKGQSN